MARNPFTRRLPGGRIVANHLPGGHDQQTHGGGRGGTATAPPRGGTRVVGGLELTTRNDEGHPDKRAEAFQPADPRDVRGDSDYDYDVAAARMHDGTIYANSDGHARAMADAFRAGYKPSDIQSVGFYWRRGSHSPDSNPAFEPYHVDDLEHIKMMMGYAGDLAGSAAEGSGWSLDKQATQHGDHDQKTHGNRDGGGEKSWVEGGMYHVTLPREKIIGPRFKDSGVASVRMKDGFVFTAPPYKGMEEGTHGDAMMVLFRKGYKPSDIAGYGYLTDYTYHDMPAGTMDHYRAMTKGAWGDFQREEKAEFSLDHLEGQHDQKTHGGGGGGGKEKSRVVGPTQPMMKGYMYSAVRMKDGTIYLPAGRGDETGTHYDALRRAFKDGYTRNDVAGFSYMTDKKLMPVDKEYSGFYRTILDTASVDHLREKEGFSLDSKRVWPLRATQHGDHDQKTHGNREGASKESPTFGTVKMAGGLVFSESKQFPATFKIESGYLKGDRNGLYAVRMQDGTVITSNDGHMHAMRLALKEYSRADFHSVGFTRDRAGDRSTTEFEPYAAKDFNHVNFMVEAAVEKWGQTGRGGNEDDWNKAIGKAGWSLDKRIWPLRSTQHTPGGHEHDQKSHGGGGGADEGLTVRAKYSPESLSRGLRNMDPKEHDEAQANISGLKREGHFYRGMTADEYNATVGAGKGIKSSQRYSLPNEGTSFTDLPEVAEDYANFGRDDPRVTGKPTYLIEVRDPGGGIKYDRNDGYYKAAGEIGSEYITRVWRMEPGKNGEIRARVVRATHHGDHDQKTHGNRQGVGGKPDDHGTKVVGGLELRKGWDVRQPVDKSKVTGVYSDRYASVQAVRMKDGSIHAHDSGHAQAMYEMMRKGYKRDDFQSVGFYLPKKSAFEPYHVRDIGHIKYMMDHAEQRARTMDLSGWSLDRRDK